MKKHRWSTDFSSQHFSSTEPPNLGGSKTYCVVNLLNGDNELLVAPFNGLTRPDEFPVSALMAYEAAGHGRVMMYYSNVISPSLKLLFQNLFISKGGINGEQGINGCCF